MAQPFRIFISSPGDVTAERRRAALIIEKLAKDYARFFEIKPYLWETEPMLASGHFQDAIVPPGETDIVLLILWARLGTPLPEQRYSGIGGRTPVTGTEWEYETAMSARERSGVPDLLAYKKKAPPKAEYKSADDIAQLGQQFEMLKAFWGRHFVDRGEIRAAFAEFEDLDGFEVKLEGDLRRLIERRIAEIREKTDAPEQPSWLTGSPFRGLETYHYEHAPIFFGRSETTKTAVEHLVQNADAERPFLLVLGASGAGKSSLAQAGIIPALTVRGVVPGVGQWCRAVVRPAGHPNGPFMALAKGLADPDALPEILKGQDIAALAKHLETAAEHPSFPIVAALGAREDEARSKGEFLSFEEVRLVVVVDQLEELFTLGDVTSDQRKAFVLCLKGLMESRRVFVVATMRSDYWHRAAETPVLVALAEGQGRLDLLPATQAELTEMIRRPAEVTGLSFETDPRTEIRLDAALAEEASREPGALPLLSFLLDALYVKDVEDHHDSTLRYATMRALGGLKGAIAARAEAAFAALPEDAQAAAPKVLRTLVTVTRAGAEPTARPVPKARFTEGSPERRVVDAFLDPQVRLLVAGDDGAGARVRVAHEALITHWDRAQRQIAQERDDLRTRTIVEEAETEWRNAGTRQKRNYLLRDPYLANAVDLARRWGDDLEQGTRDFIQASYRRARLLQRLIMAAAAVFALTTVTASILGVLAQRERTRAEAALALADRNYATALNGGSQTVKLVRDFVSAGTISTDVAESLLEVPRKTVTALESERADDATIAVEWQMFDTLSSAYLTVPGRGETALEMAQKMKEIAARLSSHKPDVESYRKDLLNSNVRIGDALEVKGDFDAALNWYQDAQAVMAKLDEIDSANPDLRRITGYIYERMGDDLYAKRDYAGAIGHYKEFLKIVEDLAQRDDAKPDWIRGLALAQERMGDALRHTGQPDEALSHYVAYQQAAQKLVAKENSGAPNYTWRLDLWISYERIAAVRYAQGGLDEALKNYVIYEKGAEEIAVRNPEQGQWQRFLANAHVGMADVLLAEGNVEDALGHYHVALQIYTQLVAKDKFQAGWQRNLALTHQRIGAALQSKSDLTAAFSEFEACLAIAVNEAAIDAQMEKPRLLHEDCQQRADQIAADLRGK